MKPHQKNTAIILFDGTCKLCNSSVRFISQRDYKNFFSYVSLQSDEADRILNSLNENFRYIDSVLLVMGDKVYSHSTAIIIISRHLSGFWPLLYILILIPKFIRNPVYKIIAKKRHKWFDKYDKSEQMSE